VGECPSEIVFETVNLRILLEPIPADPANLRPVFLVAMIA
jgi:hypothetical protein